MHSIDTNFYFISNLLNEKNKTVHEDILLGALKLPMKINYTEESGKHLQKNQGSKTLASRQTIGK